MFLFYWIGKLSIKRKNKKRKMARRIKNIILIRIKIKLIIN
jgi:hypothetical protein